MLAQREHLDYLTDKFADGWTKGPERDPVKKTNPTLVDWDELPPEERKKDFDIAENITRCSGASGCGCIRRYGKHCQSESSDNALTTVVFFWPRCIIDV